MLIIRSKYTEEEKMMVLKEYARLRSNGDSTREACSKIGVHYNTIWNWNRVNQKTSPSPSPLPNPFPTNSFLPMTILSGLGFSC